MPPDISPSYPFKSHYLEVHGSRLHYIDEGSGDPILLLHGNPTWSYLWRNIIPHVSPLGRCIALDLIGMGRSDKPDIDYRFVDHVKYVESFIEQLGLKNITLVVHDWGSALGLHYAARHAANIKGLALLEAVVTPPPQLEELPPRFKEFVKTVKGPNSWQVVVEQNFFIEQVLPANTLRALTAEELDHYREPFREPGSRKPIWRFAQENPVGGDPADVYAAVAAYSQYLFQTDTPKLLFYATPGTLIPEPLVGLLQQNLKRLTVVNVGAGLHFLQEEDPHLIGAELARWYHTL